MGGVIFVKPKAASLAASFKMYPCGMKTKLAGLTDVHQALLLRNPEVERNADESAPIGFPARDEMASGQESAMPRVK
jgi:hypothetical protein